MAVAQSNSCLNDYLNFFRRSKHLPSTTQLLLTGLPGGVVNKGNRVSRKRKREEVQDRVALSSNGKSSAKSSRPEANFSTKRVTLYNNSSTITCGYMASSLPYDPAIPGPSTSYLPYIPAGYPQHQPHPHPTSMQFNTGIGDIRVQSPTPLSAPYWPPYHTYPSYTVRVSFWLPYG